jgi:hypothetical protein
MAIPAAGRAGVAVSAAVARRAALWDRHGRPARLTPAAGGPGIPVRVIWQDGSAVEPAFEVGQARVAVRNSEIWIQKTALPAPPRREDVLVLLTDDDAVASSWRVHGAPYLAPPDAAVWICPVIAA